MQIENYNVINFPDKIQIQLNDKTYIFNKLKRISKNGNPYVGLFVKNGYRGFLNEEESSGNISIGSNKFRLRKTKDSFTLIFDGSNDIPQAKKEYKTMPHYHEDNIKAELYRKIKDLGVNIVLEYRIPHGRVDIAILDKDNKLKGFIEVKRTVSTYEASRRSNIRLDEGNRHSYKLTKQFEKYLNQKVPLLICTGYKYIPQALGYVKSLF